MNTLQVFVLFVGFFIYHFVTLRRDGGQAVDLLTIKRENFPVVVFEREGSGFAAIAGVALQKTATGVPVLVQAAEQDIPIEAAEARAVVLPSTLALDPPDGLRAWLKGYAGQKVIVPVEEKTWFWPGGVLRNAASLAAQVVRQLADGQQVRLPSGTTAWQVVAYIFAVLFALQLAFFLFSVGIVLIFNGF